MAENNISNDNNAEYCPIGVSRIYYEVDTIDGSIYKQDTIYPTINNNTLIDDMGRLLNAFMSQLGYPLYNRDLIPLVSISEEELGPLLNFLKELRADNGEDTSLSINIIED